MIFISVQTYTEPDYYNPEAVKSFADWLFMQKDYRRAAGEYLRFYFMSGESPDDTGLFRLGRCYALAGEYEKAIAMYQRLIEDFPESILIQESQYEIALIYFRLTMYRESLTILRSQLITCDLNCPRLFILSGINYLYLREWHDACTIFHHPEFNVSIIYSPDIVKLIELSERADNCKKKNPLYAGILSALIPGLGKMYAEKPGDGFFSFITIGIFGGMAAYSFYEDGPSSVKAWIYASIGGVFYLGNIYGSVIAAAHYNREQQDIILREVDEITKTLYR
jgi:tetratricopeptide (TPR) repeat protein